MGPLNAPVFVKAWDLVVRDGRYKKFDWTLKLDVDALIVAPRARTLLHEHANPGAKMYVQDVGKDAMGNRLHGAVEAVSKAGVEAYQKGAAECDKDIGSTGKGEDLYLNFC